MIINGPLCDAMIINGPLYDAVIINFTSSSLTPQLLRNATVSSKTLKLITKHPSPN